MTPARTAAVALVAAIALLVWAPPAAALDPRKRITQYGHDVWQVEDGLPQNTIRAIRQARDGYLWLGTEEGLVRFDGVRFTVFDSTTTPEMGVSFVNSIAEDEAGHLWIATNGGGLLRHHAGRFTAYLPSDKPSSLLVAAVAAGTRGLWAGNASGLLQLRGDSLVPYTGNDRLAAAGVFVLHADRRGTLWIGTRARGLLSLRDGAVRRYTVADGLADDHVWSLAESADGSVWVGTDNGASRIAPDGAITNSMPGQSVRALLEDRDGSLWAGCNDTGLRRFREGTWEEFGAAHGLSSSSVFSLHEDREGSVWVGTNGGGLNRLRDGAVTTTSVEEGLSSEAVRAVYQHPDGAVWVGTKGGGANRIAGASLQRVTTTNGLSEDTVVSFTTDRDGALWMGTVRNGLNRWKDGKLTVSRPADGLPHESVFALLARTDGSLWIGHRGGGLTRYQGGRFVNYGPADGLNSSYVWTIVEGRDGALWIGTNGGVYSLADGRFRRVIPDVASHAVHVDRDGVVWAGSATGGLYRLKDGRVSAIARREGLFDNMVAGILEDDRGNLWMSCNKGIFSVPKQQLHDVAEGRIARVQPTAYDASDGMKSRECSYGSSWKTTDGRLWFPTIRGVAVIDPANLKRNPVPPPVVIEEVAGNGRPLRASGESFVVPPGEGRLQFHYTALSLVAPKEVRFSYRLEGLEDTWTDAGSTRQAGYANLRPGRYTFRVRASNNDGVWNETGAAAHVHLQPYFHQTPWFYALCVAGLALAGWQGHRFRVRRLLALERVRTRIAADLHDDVGSGLSQIAILTGVARAQIQHEGVPPPEALAQIARTAEELVDSMSDIVWAMNPGKDQVGDLVHRMRRFATEVFTARGIEFAFRTQGVEEARRVHPDFRRHAYLLFKEGVNNAARHSGCARADVLVEAADHRFVVRISDDGKGFDIGAGADGHGLGTMKTRARELGGRLDIVSRAGEGTTLTADLPLRSRAS